jgi:hypothetical protein
MLTSIVTLDCPTPEGQPLPRERPKCRMSGVLPKPAPVYARGYARRPDGLKVGSCDAVMVDLALRPQGVSRPELREALRWKSDPYPSLMAACDKAGVEIDVIRHTEPFRYVGRYLR